MDAKTRKQEMLSKAKTDVEEALAACRNAQKRSQMLEDMACRAESLVYAVRGVHHVHNIGRGARDDPVFKALEELTDDNVDLSRYDCAAVESWHRSYVAREVAELADVLKNRLLSRTMSEETYLSVQNREHRIFTHVPTLIHRGGQYLRGDWVPRDTVLTLSDRYQ